MKPDDTPKTRVSTKDISEIHRLHSKCIKSTMGAVKDAIQCGEKLSQVKDRLSHGEWMPWIEKHLEFNYLTAHRYIKCHENRDKFNSLLNLNEFYRLLGCGDGKAHVSNNSGDNEWYTPPQFINAARQAMGSIDTDPASCETANKTVGAKKFYTAKDNGLEKEWKGNVWLNPPYSKELVPKFAAAVVQKFNTGEFTQACVLVNNATETEWFQTMLKTASAICLLETRIKFLDDTGTPANSPLQGQAILYFGNNKSAFLQSFSGTGVVLQKL